MLFRSRIGDAVGAVLAGLLVVIEHSKTDIVHPNNSIDCLFTILKQIQADKRRTANAWVTRTITKKQRDMLALLGLENPLWVLKN